MSEVYIDKHGMAHDDEGHTWKAPGMAQGVHKGTSVKYSGGKKILGVNRAKLDALYDALYYEPGNRILSYAAKVLAKGGEVNAKEAKQIRDIMKKIGMKKESKLFEDRGVGMRCLLDKIEEKRSKDKVDVLSIKPYSGGDGVLVRIQRIGTGVSSFERKPFYLHLKGTFKTEKDVKKRLELDFSVNKIPKFKYSYLDIPYSGTPES